MTQAGLHAISSICFISRFNYYSMSTKCIEPTHACWLLLRQHILGSLVQTRIHDEDRGYAHNRGLQSGSGWPAVTVQGTLERGAWSAGSYLRAWALPSPQLSAEPSFPRAASRCCSRLPLLPRERGHQSPVACGTVSPALAGRGLFGHLAL